MRKLLTVLACAGLVVGLGAPAWGNDASKSDDQPITAMGKGGGRHGGHHRDHDGRGSRGGRHHRDHDGYRHGRSYDRGYDGHRHRYGYDRYGYYGCGYYPDCDPYYGGYYGGRRYNYDRYDSCRYRGNRYDYRCDCYHRDTRCDRYYYRGHRGYYGPYSVDGDQADTSPVPDDPAAESPSPQEQSTVTAYHADDHAAPVPDKPASESVKPAPAPQSQPAPAPEAAPAPEPSSGQTAAPAPTSEPAPEPAAEEEPHPSKTVQPTSTNPDKNAEPGTGKAQYDREHSDSGAELF
jgi:hypothetical protein